MAKIPDKIETWQMMEPGKLAKTSIDVPETQAGEVLVEVDLDEAGNEGLDNIFGFFSEASGPLRVRLLLQRGSAKASVDLGKDIAIDLDAQRKNRLVNLSGPVLYGSKFKSQRRQGPLPPNPSRLRLQRKQNQNRKKRQR